jgi:hypothetical protein
MERLPNRLAVVTGHVGGVFIFLPADNWSSLPVEMPCAFIQIIRSYLKKPAEQPLIGIFCRPSGLHDIPYLLHYTGILASQRIFEVVHP